MKVIIDDIEPIAHKLVDHCQEKMGLSERPGLFFVEDDDNARKTFGKTAFYDPSNKEVVVFITGRHSKDILRSIAHELVHHMQNLRGDFDDDLDTSPGYAQKNPKLRKMEAEAYLMGNMLFRDWEDGIKSKNLQESKEKTKMNINTIKKLVKEQILKILKETREESDEEFMYGRFKDVPGHQDESDPDQWKKMEEEKVEEQSETVSTDKVTENDETKLEEVDTDGDESVEQADVSESMPGAKEIREEDTQNIEEECVDCPELEEGCPDDEVIEEDGENIQTPEQEHTLYEARYQDRNTKLFKRLMSKWIK